MIPATVPAARPAAADGVYLGRQSILDRNQDLFAFELLFRSGTTNAAHVTDDMLATATVIQNTLNEFGLESVLGPFKGFINLDAAMLMSDMLELLPRERVVLEILETVEIDQNVIERLEHLKASGFTLALDDVVSLPPQFTRLLEVIDFVKIDIQQVGMTTLPYLVQSLKPWRARLLAEKVDSRAQADACHAMGFDFFQGYYYAKPEVITRKRLAPEESTLMRLLGMLVSDADSDAIAELLKQEPVLTMNLLRLTNAVGTGARSRVSSVSSAMLLLGRRQLMRWLQLLLYSTNSRSGRLPSALMQLAATRGKMMELLASQWNEKGLEDRAFMTGIMSLMETLLAMPMADIVSPLPIADDVCAALIGRSGRLGTLLTLVESLERPGGRAIEPLLAGLAPLTASDVVNAHLQALRWANSIGG